MPSSMDDTSPTKPETPIFSEPIVRNEFHSALTSDDVTDADTIKVEEDKPHSPFDGGEWMAKLYPLPQYDKTAAENDLTDTASQEDANMSDQPTQSDQHTGSRDEQVDVSRDNPNHTARQRAWTRQFRLLQAQAGPRRLAPRSATPQPVNPRVDNHRDSDNPISVVYPPRPAADALYASIIPSSLYLAPNGELIRGPQQVLEAPHTGTPLSSNAHSQSLLDRDRMRFNSPYLTPNYPHPLVNSPLPSHVPPSQYSNPTGETPRFFDRHGAEIPRFLDRHGNLRYDHTQPFEQVQPWNGYTSVAVAPAQGAVGSFVESNEQHHSALPVVGLQHIPADTSARYPPHIEPSPYGLPRHHQIRPWSGYRHADVALPHGDLQHFQHERSATPVVNTTSSQAHNTSRFSQQHYPSQDGYPLHVQTRPWNAHGRVEARRVEAQPVAFVANAPASMTDTSARALEQPRSSQPLSPPHEAPMEVQQALPRLLDNRESFQRQHTSLPNRSAAAKNKARLGNGQFGKRKAKDSDSDSIPFDTTSQDAFSKSYIKQAEKKQKQASAVSTTGFMSARPRETAHIEKCVMYTLHSIAQLEEILAVPDVDRRAQVFLAVMTGETVPMRHAYWFTGAGKNLLEVMGSEDLREALALEVIRFDDGETMTKATF